MRNRTIAVLALGSLMLAGCAMTPLGPTVRVMPGPYKPFEVFQRDQFECTQYADSMVAGQAEAANNRALGATAIDGAGNVRILDFGIAAPLSEILQAIREFRNRPEPGVVVSVDLMSTGVDIPDLEYPVFLRPIKSRILFEQMLGRGTRKG